MTASLALLGACSGSTSGEPITKAGVKTASDSVSYYYGQLVARQYDMISAQDTILKSEAARKAYYEGMARGMGLLKEGDSPEAKAYNQGVTFGLQLTSNMKQMTADIPELKFSEALFGKGFWYTFSGDSIRNVDNASMELDRIMNGMQQRAEVANKAALEKAMGEYAKKNGFTKQGDLFVKTVKPGQGALLQQGDSINFSVSLMSSTGRNLDQYAMRDNAAVIGKTLPMEYPYAQQLLKMRSGSEVKVLMTADALFGGAARQFGFTNGEFLIVTLQPLFVAKTAWKPQVTAQPQAAPAVKATEKK